MAITNAQILAQQSTIANLHVTTVQAQNAETAARSTLTQMQAQKQADDAAAVAAAAAAAVTPAPVGA